MLNQGILGSLNNILGYLQTIIRAENICKFLDKNTINYSASAGRYGFNINDDLEIDVENFIGVDSKIMISPEHRLLDKTLFIKKGTLDEELENLDELFNAASNNHCYHAMRAMLAIACIGPVKQLLGSQLPLGNYCVTGESGCGKSLLAVLIQKVWGKPGESGIRFSSESTAAGLKPTRTHLNIIPSIIDDVQDMIIKENGLNELKEICYGITNSANAAKATAGGKKRQDDFSWNAPAVMFGETNTFISVDIDGAGNRVWIFNTNRVKGQYITKEIPSTYSKINHTYGHIGPEFVKKLREYYKTHNIEEEFNDLVKLYMNFIKFDKKARLAAIVQYVFNLLVDFELLPITTDKMTIEEVLMNYDEDNAATSEELVYKTFVERIFRDRESYPDKNLKMIQADYEEAKKQGNTIRGKIFIEDGNYKLFISPENFVKNVNDIAKTLNLKGIVPDVAGWKNRGWAEYNKQGRKTWNTTGISYEYDKNDIIRSKKENCYKIILGTVEEDAFEENTELFKNRNISEESKKNISKYRKELILAGESEESANLKAKIYINLEEQGEEFRIPYTM
jgi:hypothetical protein